MVSTIECRSCICAVRDEQGNIIGCLDYASLEECIEDQVDSEMEYRLITVE